MFRSQTDASLAVVCLLACGTANASGDCQHCHCHLTPSRGMLPLVWSMTTSTCVSGLESDRYLHACRSLRYHAPVVDSAAAQLACVSAVARPSTDPHEVDADYSAHLEAVTAPSGKECHACHLPRTMQTGCLWEPRFSVHSVYYPLAASWCRHGAAVDIAVFMDPAASRPRYTCGLVLNPVRPQSLRCFFRTHMLF